jgi:hypothetical protein
VSITKIASVPGGPVLRSSSATEGGSASRPYLSSVALCVGGLISLTLSALGTPNPLYFSANGSGSQSGADVSDCQTRTFVANPTNWGSGTGQIPNGNTLSLVGVCGAINVYGNNITILVPGGSGFSEPYQSSILIANGTSGITIDGTGGGFIACTANGSGLANQAATQAIQVDGTTAGITIKNIAITNIYVHTLASDSAISSDECCGFYCNELTGNCLFSGIVFSNVGTALLTQGDCTETISNCTFQCCNHGVYPSGTAGASWTVEKCLFGTCSNWNTGASDTYHNDGIIWGGATSSTALTSIVVNGNTFNGVQGADNTAYIFFYQGSAVTATMMNNLFIVNPGDTLNNGCFNAGALTAILNNTFINNGPPQSCITQGNNLALMNNLFVGFGTFLSLPFALSGSAISNNMYVNPQSWGNSPWMLNGTGYSTFASWTNTSGDGGSRYFSGVNANTVVNTNTGALVLGSPAIGAGNTNVYALGVTAWAAAGLVDIGEYVWSIPGLDYGLTFTNP